MSTFPITPYPTSTPMTTTSTNQQPMDLNSLLRQSMGLVSHIDQAAPTVIHRSIHQLDATSRKLARQTMTQGTTQEPTQIQNKAQLFLASTGLDVSHHVRTLSTIDLSRTYEPVESLSELDVDSYLEHHHQLLINTCIEEVTQQTATAFARAESTAMETEWERAKREIMESMGFRSGPRQTITTSLITPVRANEPMQSPAQTRPTTRIPSLSLSTQLYATCIQNLNHARQQHQSFPIVTALRETRKQYEQQQESTSIHSSTSELLDVLDLLTDLIGERTSEPIQPYQYHHDYMQQTLLLRQILIDGVKSYLERLYQNYMISVCTSQPQLAQRSGIPGTIHTVRGYINCIRHTLPDTMEGLVDDYPLWVQLFYCIRCGDWRAALELCRRAQASGIELTTFTAAVEQRAQGKQLPIPLWKRLSEEYNRDILNRERTDPFRVALYHIIGRVKPNPHVDLIRHVVPTTEDYMWLKLITTWEQTEPLPDWLWNQNDAQALTLGYLQQAMLKRGEAHFNQDGRNPLRYFKVLLMCQLFEHAIYYLVRTEHFEFAVHVAIALDYVGLIRRTESSGELLISNPRGSSLNYIRIIRKYVDSFATTHAEHAFHYLLLLRLPTLDMTENDASYDAMCQLILDTKEYAVLVGQKRGNVMVKRGCLFQFYSPADANLILTMAAERASQQGQPLDAIQLYTYAEHMNDAAQLLIKSLARLTTTSVSNVERQLLIQQASSMVSQQQNTESNTSLSSSLLSTLIQLLSLCQFFDLYHIGIQRYDDALEIVSSLQLIPIRGDGSDVEMSVTRWEQADQHIRRLAADVAMATMEMYYAKYKQIRSETTRTMTGQTPRDAARQKLVTEYRGRARALINFVGLQQSYIGADLNAKLVRLEALMP